MTLKARLAALEARAAEAKGSPLSRELRRAYLAALGGRDVEPAADLEAHDAELVLALVGALEAVPRVQRQQMEARAAKA